MYLLHSRSVNKHCRRCSSSLKRARADACDNAVSRRSWLLLNCMFILYIVTRYYYYYYVAVSHRASPAVCELLCLVITGVVSTPGVTLRGFT